jgi:hypothetical protein
MAVTLGRSFRLEVPDPPHARRDDQGAGAGPLAERRNVSYREALIRRISGEFDEMPGMRLTSRQAIRLFGLREDVCLRILEELRREGRLRLTTAGFWTRHDREL